jgi:hypothetical protein
MHSFLPAGCEKGLPMASGGPQLKNKKKQKKKLPVIDETEMPNHKCTKLPTGKSLLFMHSLAVKLNFLYMGKTK